MDPREFLRASELLIVKGGEAAHCRSAVGRAYYASFLFASKTLGELGCPPPSGPQGHEHTVRLLQRCGDAELEATGGLLSDLARCRRDADYHMSKTYVEKLKNAQANHESALSIIKDLENFMKDGERRAVVAPILKLRCKEITGKDPS
jgi:uncharacterized protein (UPF0332 family)